MILFKTTKDILNFIESTDSDSVLLVGHENALTGIVETFHGLVCVYDKDKIIKNLMKDMTKEDAEEYFDFNIIGSFVGDLSPIYMIGSKYRNK